MKTVRTVKTVAGTDSLVFGYWDNDTEEFVSLTGMSHGEAQAAAIKLECSELLLDALVMFAASISEVVGTDLKDIWKKVAIDGRF